MIRKALICDGCGDVLDLAPPKPEKAPYWYVVTVQLRHGENATSGNPVSLDVCQTCREDYLVLLGRSAKFNCETAVGYINPEEAS